MPKILQILTPICAYARRRQMQLQMRGIGTESKASMLSRAGSQLSSAVRRILWWVFTGNRGGPNRARVVFSLREQPMNANQLAQKLGMDYKTIRHHLGVLIKNRLVIEVGKGYGAMYFISPPQTAGLAVLLWMSVR